MYKVNDLIVYGNDGVCRVEEICTPDISGINKDKLYYVLENLYRDGKTYTPVDTTVFMRPIITGEVAKELMDHIPSITAGVYKNTSMRLLEDHYKVMLRTHECVDLIELIKEVSAKKRIAVSKGKKPGQIDDRYMKRAKELLYGEFAAALGVSKESVKDHIEQQQ